MIVIKGTIIIRIPYYNWLSFTLSYISCYHRLHSRLDNLQEPIQMYKSRLYRLYNIFYDLTFYTFNYCFNHLILLQETRNGGVLWPTKILTWDWIKWLKRLEKILSLLYSLYRVLSSGFDFIYCYYYYV